ncbi:MAG: type VI secretion system-associated protein TagO [Phreatobacter sp.]
MARIRVFALAAATLLGIVAHAAAQDDPRAALGRCTGIAADAERLRCFDQIARPAQPTPGRVGNWEVQTTTSPVDDSRIVSATQKPAEAWGEERIALNIRCFEGQTSLSVSRDSLLAVGRTAKVIVRIDSQPATDSQWTIANTSLEAMLPENVIGFLRSLPATGRLFIRVEGVRNIRFEGTFRLEGLNDIRRNVGEACRWPAPASRPAPGR